jgi:hypothetical protein
MLPPLVCENVLIGMIYTCYEMVNDCLAGKPEGWSYFAAHYILVIRRLLTHYFPARMNDGELLGRVLTTLRRPESGLFQTVKAGPERIFLTELRQKVMAALELEFKGAAVPAAIDAETLLGALSPLTVIEKQAVWFETMRYDAADAARMLRMDPKTVDQVRQKGAALVRGKVDQWSINLLPENGPLLGHAAAESSGKDCLPPKQFLDMIDGRTTWASRESIDRHVGGCLHCLDHFCRLIEVVDLLRDLQPLADAEAAPYRALLGVPEPKPSGWRRVFGVGKSG